MMYRRFGQLHARLLLHRQDRLRGLEDELGALDAADAAMPGRQNLLRCREDDDAADPPGPAPRSRAAVLDEIQEVLAEYGEHGSTRSSPPFYLRFPRLWAS